MSRHWWKPWLPSVPSPSPSTPVSTASSTTRKVGDSSVYCLQPVPGKGADDLKRSTVAYTVCSPYTSPASCGLNERNATGFVVPIHTRLPPLYSYSSVFSSNYLHYHWSVSVIPPKFSSKRATQIWSYILHLSPNILGLRCLCTRSHNHQNRQLLNSLLATSLWF